MPSATEILDLADRLLGVARGLAQGGEAGHAPHVALAPRGDAVAHPMFLGDDLAVELLRVALFLLEHGIAPGLEFAKAPVEPLGDAAVEPDRGPRQVLQEAPVMADQHEGRAQARQFAFEPFDRRQVEMVGRLVEQQDVGLRRQRAGERRAAALAARQVVRVFGAGQAQRSSR